MATRGMNGPNSRSLPVWHGRSHIAVFVRCLHLLDFDLMEDWPGVNEQLFTAKVAQQNLQQRIKAVEWSLYRLFEIYDLEETKDKLRPFFPPVAPLQSLNLRAALYRCLTDLKKNGVLGRDVVLRKTMLDDCKGERFEEVVANLAMTVLRKVTNVPQNGGQTLVMILAYRGSLHNNLDYRKEADAATQQKLGNLEAVQMSLKQRLEQAKACSAEIDITQQKRLRALVNENWIGQYAWTDVLFQGAFIQNEMIEESQPDAAKTKSPSSNLESLDSCLQKHQARLLEWKVAAKDIKLRRNQDISKRKAESHPAKKDTSGLLRFSKHKELNESNWNNTPTLREPQDEKYDRLLNAMKRELAAQSNSTKRRVEKKTASSAPSSSAIHDGLSIALKSADRVVKHRLSSEGSSSIGPTAQTLATDNATSEPSNQYDSSDSPSPIQDSDMDSPWIPTQDVDADPTRENIPIQGKNFSPIGIEEPEQPMSPSSVWLSLADRTRASISLTSRRSMLGGPDSHVSQSTDQVKSRVSSNIHQSSDDDDDDRYTSLVERTRKSMSLLSSSSASRARKTKNNSEKRISQVYPINQFETPGRPERQVDWTLDSGVATPKEQLFDEDAEYASIFKSRPKLALSPAFSPERRTSGLDSILERDMEQLNLDSDESN